ncbi:MAG TPA: helix-turn-helix domain-containing protein [Aldersonia sp.]
MDVEDFVVDAFAQLRIETRPRIGAPDDGVDLVVDPDGVRVAVQVKFRSLVTDDVAERLLAQAPPPGTALLVVADRVTDTARTALTRRRGGYLDLRGRLALHTDRLVIDADVEPVTTRTERTAALSGKAGLEVVTAVLMRPERTVAVRELARELGRSPSTVSEILAALRRDGILDARNALQGTDLFWQVADHWPSHRVHLAKLPAPDETTLRQPLRLGLDVSTSEQGWALTDTAAAAAYCASLAFRSGHALDFYVPDKAIIRRATTLLGTATSAMQAQATLRVAPVPAVVRQRIQLDTNPLAEWPLAIHCSSRSTWRRTQGGDGRS